MVSSTRGEIGELLLTVPGWVAERGEGDGLVRGFRALLAALPDDVRVIVYTHEAQVRTLEEWLAAAGKLPYATVVGTDDTVDFTMWAEDPYVTGLARDQTYLIEPWSFRRSADGLIADQLAHSTRLRSTQTPLYFEGGNVLVGDRHILVGFDYAAETAEAAPIVFRSSPPSTDEVRAVFSSFLDVGRTILFPRACRPTPPASIEIVPIDRVPTLEAKGAGNGVHQPVFHIDMFVTLAGPDRNGRPRALVGDARLAKKLVPAIPDNPLAARFDEVAEFLERHGFVVGRLPIAEIFVDWTRMNRRDIAARYGHHHGLEAVLEQMDAEDKPQMPVRHWYTATWNNALVSYAESGRGKVLMPEYGFDPWPELKTLDAEAAATWNALGFEVAPLGNFHPFAELQGAAHCICKYIARA